MKVSEANDNIYGKNFNNKNKSVSPQNSLAILDLFLSKFDYGQIVFWQPFYKQDPYWYKSSKYYFHPQSWTDWGLDTGRSKVTLRKRGYQDSQDGTCECGTEPQTMKHLLSFPQLEQPCTQLNTSQRIMIVLSNALRFGWSVFSLCVDTIRRRPSVRPTGH